MRHINIVIGLFLYSLSYDSYFRSLNLKLYGQLTGNSPRIPRCVIEKISQFKIYIKNNPEILVRKIERKLIQFIS